MDYRQKYLKYKAKYLDLKENMHGGLNNNTKRNLGNNKDLITELQNSGYTDDIHVRLTKLLTDNSVKIIPQHYLNLHNLSNSLKVQKRNAKGKPVGKPTIPQDKIPEQKEREEFYASKVNDFLTTYNNDLTQLNILYKIATNSIKRYLINKITTTNKKVGNNFKLEGGEEEDTYTLKQIYNALNTGATTEPEIVEKYLSA